MGLGSMGQPHFPQQSGSTAALEGSGHLGFRVEGL